MFASLMGSQRKKFLPERECLHLAGKARVMCPAPRLSLWSLSSYREESQSGKSYVQAACRVEQASDLSDLSWVKVL